MDLPERCRADDDLLKLIQCMKQLTGRIDISGHRAGTGFIQRIRFVHGKCPCSVDCRDSRYKYAILTVSTVVHIFDDKPDRKDLLHEFVRKPETAQIILDYERDDDDLSCLPTLYGHRLLETDKDLGIDSDWCCLEFVSHELRLVEELNTSLTSYQELQGKVYQKYKGESVNLVVLVGHPGRRPKQISIGKTIRKYKILKEIRDGQKWGRYYYDAPTEKGSSGSPVFVLGQPISGFAYWFGHPHNHSAKKTEKINYSSIGVEYVV
ncbi:unnamed protein product [Lymnaea stagnalis]|uniref:Uncharacterized protein n=1 Tax=Lymnaea stagnalis TaxID=6523 RepID=A0AAV2ID39_LYMST